MICDRYDVVVVPFPFDEIPVRKRRPVLVFSGRSFNEFERSFRRRDDYDREGDLVAERHLDR